MLQDKVEDYMFCYNCGCSLSEHDFCTSCGAEVGVYKKVMQISNLYYNEGLTKAKIRDLTGAITSLRQSLKFNKNNIEARNLLGLVYFEMGEVVAALSEWVISKNLQSNKNIADAYISMIQANAARLDSINQTVKKYNQALAYCKNDSKDLAVIQLRKVLSLNPKFVRAHLLLALCYIETEQWDRGKRELHKCLELDRNNLLAITYLKEVDSILEADEVSKTGRKKSSNSVRFQSDNEVIIQPLALGEPKQKSASSLFNIGLGLLIGVAVTYYLIVPAIRTNINNESQQTISEIGNQIDAKNTVIANLERNIEELQSENERLHRELDAYVGTDGTLQTIENLLNAANLYISSQDLEQTAENLEVIYQNVSIEDTSEAYQTLYATLHAAIGPQMTLIYYNAGYTAFQAQNYEEAIVAFKRAIEYDSTHGDAWYNLGNAYRLNGNNEEAIAAYEKFIELLPETERASRARRYITTLSEG